MHPREVHSAGIERWCQAAGFGRPGSRPRRRFPAKPNESGRHDPNEPRARLHPNELDFKRIRTDEPECSGSPTDTTSNRVARTNPSGSRSERTRARRHPERTRLPAICTNQPERVEIQTNPGRAPAERTRAVRQANEPKLCAIQTNPSGAASEPSFGGIQTNPSGARKGSSATRGHCNPNEPERRAYATARCLSPGLFERRIFDRLISTSFSHWCVAPARSWSARAEFGGLGCVGDGAGAGVVARVAGGYLKVM
jgi:hypothetical protein